MVAADGRGAEKSIAVIGGVCVDRSTADVLVVAVVTRGDRQVKQAARRERVGEVGAEDPVAATHGDQGEVVIGTGLVHQLMVRRDAAVLAALVEPVRGIVVVDTDDALVLPAEQRR